MKRFMITLLSLLPLFAAAQRGFKFASEMVTFSVDSTSDVLIQINVKQAPDTRSRAVARIASLNPKVLSDNRYLVPSSKLAKNEIEYTSQLYTDNHGGKTYVLPRIIASVKPGTDVIALLKSYPSVTLAERSGKIIKLDCAVTSSETVWKLVASLSKAEDMEWCEPDMLSEIQTCNTLYDQQYYLKNRGQKGGKVGIDIHVEPAWEITNGEYVTVAVIDQGVDRDHEDMGGRVLEGYTVGDPAGKGTPQNPNKYNCKAHGMACAGIVAAEDNKIGIRGVANKAKILPVNINPNYAVNRNNSNFSSSDEIATAIRWASLRADVLSNSWGGGTYSNNVASAIADAQTKGRNGKGCVVVFSAGNLGEHPHTDASFPGNLPGVITVGAIDKKGVILPYSQRGPSLDLVAPSGPGNGDVVTTDRMGALGYGVGNYTNTFNGTSAACPQVAGVAALMLSVNPSLTEEQVRTTLQQTARDLGPTGFDPSYGYGLVDAAAAVNAVAFKIEGNTYVSKHEIYTVNGLPNGYSVLWRMRGTSKFGVGDMSAKQCSVTIIGDLPISGTLCAYIMEGSDTVGVLVKRLYTHSKFVGTYEQESCYYYRQHPTIPPKNLLTDIAVFVQQGCPVTIRSEMLDGVTFTYDGVTPEIWFEGKDYLTFSFPLYSGGIPMNIYGKNGNLCEDFHLLFFSVSDNLDIPKSSMRVATNGKLLTVTITNAESVTNKAPVLARRANGTAGNWTLEVYGIQNGNKVLGITALGNSYELNTSGWLPGVYLIRAVVGEDILIQKIEVE